MIQEVPKRQEGRLSVPCTLLILSLVALIVSLVGLQRATTIANERFAELQVFWSTIEDGSIEGSELLETDRLIRSVATPVPAATVSSRWSLALAAVSLCFLFWLIFAVRRDQRDKYKFHASTAQNEQAAIVRLTDEITAFSEGDLRVRATVDDNLTAPLADSFNHAVGELRWLVTSLTSASKQLNEAVESSNQHADRVTNSSIRQSEHIHQSSNFLLALVGTMADLSANASERASAAQAMVEKSARVKSSITGARNQCLAINEEVKHSLVVAGQLGEALRAIEEQVQVIQDVAKRTDLLALNTTIRASAGSDIYIKKDDSLDAGTDLGRLSDEVAIMADDIGQATTEIGTLSHGLTQIVTQIRLSIERIDLASTTGLEDAKNASGLLNELSVESKAIRNHLLQFSEATVEHSGIVSQLSENMDVINRITQENAATVNASAESLGDLLELSAELKQSTDNFKMPGKVIQSSPEKKVTVSAARQAADRAVING